MSATASEFRQALVRIRRRPAGASATIIVLALALGVNGVLLSAIHAALLKPLPYRQASELVAVQDPRRVPREHLLEGETARALSEKAGSLPAIGFYRLGVAGQHSYQWNGRLGVDVSLNIFSTLGVDADLRLGERRAPRTPAGPGVIVGADIWREISGGSDWRAGITLPIGAEEIPVIAVMPRDFWFPTTDHRFWVVRPAEWISASSELSVVTRVPHGTVDGSAEVLMEMGAAIDRSRSRNPRWWRQSSLDELNTPADAKELLIAQLAATLFLIIAIATVVSLATAAALRARHHDWIRWALGASRFARMRPFLAEAALTSSGAVLFGLLLSALAIAGLGHLLNSTTLADTLLASLPLVSALSAAAGLIVTMASGATAASTVRASDEVMAARKRSPTGFSMRHSQWMSGFSVSLGLGVILSAQALFLIRSRPIADPIELAAGLAADDAFVSVGRLLLAVAGVAVFGTCAGLAGVFAQRFEVRRRELQIRAAVGASPAQLVRTLLHDSIYPAVLALLSGGAIAWLGFPMVAAFLSLEASRDIGAATIATASVAAALGVALSPTLWRASRTTAARIDRD